MNVNYNIARRCKLAKGVLPSFTPVIYNLSVDTSLAGTYSNVIITGQNFLPNGTTYVNFGGFTNIPVSYFSSFMISFVVPTNATAGSYNVVVVNTYNSNYSANISNIYNQNINFSNSVAYTLT
jgi:uncharacterized protein (TIGR03437 family)